MLWILLLSACAPEPEGCAPAVAAGEVAATIGDADWSATDATWRMAGASVQLNASAADSSSLSFVLQTTTDGEGVDVAAAPFVVDLGDAGGGWLTVYPESGASLTTQAGEGTLEVAAVGDTFSACFHGTVAGTDGAAQDVAGELVAASAE